MQDRIDIMTMQEVSEKIFLDFYRYRDSAKRHIHTAAGITQRDFIDDIYHESLILAHKRKMEDLDRTYSLCMFSAYNTIMRTGFYLHLKKEDKLSFLMEEDLDIESDIKTPEQLAISADNFKLVIESIVILFLYSKKKAIKSIEALSRLKLSEGRETLAAIGRTWGVTRERVRQLSNQAIDSVREIIRLLLNPDLLITERPPFLRKVNFILSDHEECLRDLPRIYTLDYLISETRYSGFDVMIIHLIAIIKYSKPENILCDDSELIDFLTKGTITMSTPNSNYFLSVPNTVITIWYKSEYQTIDICYGREVLSMFEKREKGWLDIYRFENSDEQTDEDFVYYKDIPELIDDSLLDFLSESLDPEQYEESEKAITDMFFDLEE